jgi:hypothetical protein
MPALADLGALLEQTALYDAAHLGADLGAAHGGDPPGQFVLQADGVRTTCMVETAAARGRRRLSRSAGRKCRTEAKQG